MTISGIEPATFRLVTQWDFTSLTIFIAACGTLFMAGLEHFSSSSLPVNHTVSVLEKHQDIFGILKPEVFLTA